MIDFVDERSSKSGKTLIWTVTSSDGLHHLGQVAWYGRWRKYTFFPQGETIFDSTCMRKIADFCDQKTASHRAARAT